MTDSLATSSIRIASAQRKCANWHEVSDRQLVEFCLLGMEEAWTELLRRYHRLILSVLSKTLPVSLRQPSVLLDLLQEVLVKLCAKSFRALRDFEWRHESSLRGLLQITSSTIAHDYRRRWLCPCRDIRQEITLNQLKYEREAQNAHSAAEQRILLYQLARGLAQQISPEPHRTRDIAMFLLYFGYGLRSADLARLYQLNLKTVESKLTRLCRLARLHVI